MYLSDDELYTILLVFRGLDNYFYSEGNGNFKPEEVLVAKKIANHLHVNFKLYCC